MTDKQIREKLFLDNLAATVGYIFFLLLFTGCLIFIPKAESHGHGYQGLVNSTEICAALDDACHDAVDAANEKATTSPVTKTIALPFNPNAEMCPLAPSSDLPAHWDFIDELAFDIYSNMEFHPSRKEKALKRSYSLAKYFLDNMGKVRKEQEQKK